MIKVENLKKQYGDNVVLKDISLNVKKGEAFDIATLATVADKEDDAKLDELPRKKVQ